MCLPKQVTITPVDLSCIDVVKYYDAFYICTVPSFTKYSKFEADLQDSISPLIYLTARAFASSSYNLCIYEGSIVTCFLY